MLLSSVESSVIAADCERAEGRFVAHRHTFAPACRAAVETPGTAASAAVETLNRQYGSIVEPFGLRPVQLCAARVSGQSPEGAV